MTTSSKNIFDDIVEVMFQDVVEESSVGLEEVELDVKDCEQTIASLEAQLLDVTVTLESIESNGGVSRQDIERFAEFLPQDYPLASFTQRPSMTNVDVATVSLEGRVAYVLSAIAVAIATLIVKLFTWLRKRRKGDEKTEKKKSQAVDALKSLEDKLKDNRPDVEIVETYNQKAVERDNAYREMVFQQRNPVLMQLFGLQRTMLTTHVDTIVECKEFFEQLAKNEKQDRSMGENLSLASQFGTLRARLETQAQQVRRELTPAMHLEDNFSPNDLKSTSDIMSSVKDQLERLRQQKPKAPFNITAFVDGWVEGQIVLLQEWVPDYQFRYDNQTERSLTKLRQVGEELKRMKVPEFSDISVTDAAKDSLRALNAEVAAIYRYLQILTQVSDTETWFVKLVTDYIQELRDATNQ